MTPRYLRKLTAVGTAAESGDISQSASCGAFSNSGGAITAVTNLSVSLKATGNSIITLKVVNDGTTNEGIFGGAHASSGDFKYFIYKNGVQMSKAKVAVLTAATNWLPTCLEICDFAPTEGTHTYDLRVQAGAGTTIILEYLKLIGYEQ